MKLKDAILQKFHAHPGTLISGQALAEEFHVSRAAVWKAIRQLKQEGYAIDASSHNGYCFAEHNDILNESEIRRFLNNDDVAIHVLNETDSTNNYAKRLLNDGLHSPAFIVANAQTGGRGRHGHTFYSPADTGLYTSLVLFPKRSLNDVLKVTAAAGVAAVEAIEECSDAHPGIKWVNDLYLNNKKIGGILTEAVSDFESHEVESIIIGIGINCFDMVTPDELQGIVGSINDPNLSRNRLAACLYRKLRYWTSHLDDAELMDRYRACSVLIGRTVTYTLNNETFSGKVSGINDQGNLLVNGIALQSGEVSVLSWD